LQRNLGLDIHFEPGNDFMEERELVLKGGFQIVYANPFSAVVFKTSLNYIPVARPIGLFDETILVAKEDPDSLLHRPLQIASATDKLIVHALGFSLLEKLGIPLSDCEFQFTGTHLKSIQYLIQDKVDLCFVFNETWNGLSNPARQGLKVIAETSSREAYHCFFVLPEWSDKFEKIQELLCNMQNNEQGKRVLEELKLLNGFEPISPSSLDGMINLVNKMELLYKLK